MGRTANDAIKLTPLELGIVGWMGRSQRSAVAVGTVIVCTASVALTIGCLSISGIPSDVWPIAIVIAIAVPGVLTPFILGYLGRLLTVLDCSAIALEQAANIDYLTGCLNRRGFFAAVGDVHLDASVADLLIIDLDDFKELNDSRGHDFGDRALVAVSSWMKELAGPTGLVGRIGGDEFVCVIPRSDGPATLDHETIEVDQVVVSMSIGVVPFDPAYSVSELMMAADSELYVAKRAKGRRPFGEAQVRALSEPPTI